MASNHSLLILKRTIISILVAALYHVYFVDVAAWVITALSSVVDLWHAIATVWTLLSMEVTKTFLASIIS